MHTRKTPRSVISSLTGLILTRFAKRPRSPQPEDLRKADFPTSTQHLGVRFTDRIRNVFRFRWLRPPRR